MSTSARKAQVATRAVNRCPRRSVGKIEVMGLRSLARRMELEALEERRLRLLNASIVARSSGSGVSVCGRLLEEMVLPRKIIVQYRAITTPTKVNRKRTPKPWLSMNTSKPLLSYCMTL